MEQKLSSDLTPIIVTSKIKITIAGKSWTYRLMLRRLILEYVLTIICSVLFKNINLALHEFTTLWGVVLLLIALPFVGGYI